MGDICSLTEYLRRMSTHAKFTNYMIQMMWKMPEYLKFLHVNIIHSYNSMHRNENDTNRKNFLKINTRYNTKNKHKVSMFEYVSLNKTERLITYKYGPVKLRNSSYNQSFHLLT